MVWHGFPRMHAQVLEEYVKLFDMRDKTFVEALRAFLKEFRLPGEVCMYECTSMYVCAIVKLLNPDKKKEEQQGRLPTAPSTR